MRTAWPSRRLIPTATASANAVQTGALHPKPALALRHQNVKIDRQPTAISPPAARDTVRAALANRSSRARAIAVAPGLATKAVAASARKKRTPR